MVTKEAFTKLCKVCGCNDEYAVNHMWKYQSEYGMEAFCDAYPLFGVAVKAYEVGDYDGYIRGCQEVRAE